MKVLFSYGKINIKGEGIINLIDVGAIGNLPSPWFENSKKIKNLLAFEPNDAAIQQANYIKVDKALWSSEEEKDFYIYNQIDGSSLYKQNYDYVDEHFDELKNNGNIKLANSWHHRSTLVKTEKLSCTTLDLVLLGLDDKIEFDFVKIDCQGAEYEILKGAEEFLKTSCIGLHLELFNIPLYKNIKLLPEVAEYLKTFDFVLAYKFPPHGTFHSQNDCLFLKAKVAPEKKKVLDCIKEIYSI